MIEYGFQSSYYNSNSGNEFYSMLKSLDRNEKGALIREVLSSKALGEMIVTPKDIFSSISI